MSINSSAVAYNFGQLGSVVSNVAKPVVPPKGMVITAIQFLSDSTPTALVSEKRVSSGAGFPNITGSTDAVGAADGFMNHNGVTTAAATGSNSGAIVTISAANSKIKVGQYVLIVNDNDAENTGLTVDSETPIPIYSGDNEQGVFVTAYVAGATTVTLSADTTPTSSQTLVFLDEVHGAGGTRADGVIYPKGLTIVGRWTTITPSADADGGVICYFGY